MTLRHLKIFLAVCNHNNMTLAGKELFMTQPAISQAIKELEDYYKVQLFERISRKLYITEAGNVLFNYAVHIVSLFDETENRLSSKTINTALRIGANVSVGTTMMQKAIKEFQKKEPEVEISVYINNSSFIREKLDQNELDFALVEELNHMEYYNVEPFFQDKIVVVAWPGHPLLQKKELLLKDIVNEKFLLREQGSGVRRLFESVLYTKGYKITPIWESYTTKSLVNGVKAELGLSVLPYRLVKEYLERDELAELKIKDINLKRQLVIIYHNNKLLSKSAIAFLKLFKRIDFEDK